MAPADRSGEVAAAVPWLGEPADATPAGPDEEEVPALADPGADDETTRPDEPAVPPPAGALETDPAPWDGSRFGDGAVTDGTDGVGTGTGALGTVSVGTVGVGTVGAGTVGVGTLGVGTVGVGSAGTGTVGVGSEMTVGTVSAGLEPGPISSASIAAATIPASPAGKKPRVQAPARFTSRLPTPLQPPVIARR